MNPIQPPSPPPINTRPPRAFPVVRVVLLCLLVGGLVEVGAWYARNRPAAGNTPAAPAAAARATAGAADAPEIIDGTAGVNRLPAARPYEPADNTLVVELSKYAGYAGLVAANGGLEPSESSVFFKKHGFKVRLTLSEEESWPALQTGKMAASATTVDVLAVYGKQFDVIVPAQIGYSRGADGIVVRDDVRSLNDLRGKTISTAQFTESDFLIRYLAAEAGLAVNRLADLKAPPDPDKLNLVFCADGTAAGNVFLRDVQRGDNDPPQLAGCVTWEPKTGQVVVESHGKAHLLVNNANLLIVADILIVNKGFADAHPDQVAGLVDGLLQGNRLVRVHPEDYAGIVGDAFGWDGPKARAELEKVHLANLPENLAFFNGAIDAAGSFGSIYDSAVLAYGREIIPDPADGDRFVQTSYLANLEKSGAFAGQKIAIAPIRTGKASVERDPLLSKDIRFLFEANSATLDLNNPQNLQNLAALKRLLTVSPGSRLMLRGHVDNARVEEFRREGGESLVRQRALSAMQLSKDRAKEIKRLLAQREGVATDRVETVGRGWEEPKGTDAEKNRRVEAQWFTVE